MALALPGGLVSAWFSVLPGFVPAVEPLLFRQKWPKPLLPGCGPVGGTFAPGQIMVANNSLRSNRFAR